MGELFRLLGTIAGALSLFKLLHQAINFGLSDAFQTIFDYYVKLVYPIIGVIELPISFIIGLLGFSLPNIWHEIALIYFVFSGALFRASRLSPWLRWSLPSAVILSLLWPIGVFVLWSAKGTQGTNISNDHLPNPNKTPTRMPGKKDPRGKPKKKPKKASIEEVEAFHESSRTSLARSVAFSDASDYIITKEILRIIGAFSLFLVVNAAL